jgi:hypothetical protein
VIRQRKPLQRNMPLRRSAPPKRKTRLKQRRATKRRSSRIHDPAFMARVREMPCRAPHAPQGCGGRMTFDHGDHRGLGQKCSDRRGLPLCWDHHQDRTGKTGPFAGWTKPQMRVWLDSEMAVTEQRIAAEDRVAAAWVRQLGRELTRGQWAAVRGQAPALVAAAAPDGEVGIPW